MCLPDFLKLVDDYGKAVSLYCHSHPGPERTAAKKRMEEAKEALKLQIHSLY